MKKDIYRSGLASLVMLLAGGCGSLGTALQDTALPSTITYKCANDRLLQVARAPNGRSASVKAGEQAMALNRADSAAQEKYSDGSYSLYLDGERAMLERNGVVLLGPCDAGPLPTTDRMRY